MSAARLRMATAAPPARHCEPAGRIPRRREAIPSIPARRAPYMRMPSGNKGMGTFTIPLFPVSLPSPSGEGKGVGSFTRPCRRREHDNDRT
jgi:hypothetical protein